MPAFAVENLLRPVPFIFNLLLIRITAMNDTLGCRLYLISPPVVDPVAFPDIFARALDGGDVASFQLRLKGATDAEILQMGEKLLPLCSERGIPFILNDRLDLAKQLGADGVHLGIDDGAVTNKVEQARKLLGENAVIGVSCYDSGDLAIQAGEDGADYVSFGAFFPSKTKQSRGKPDPEILKWWSTWTVLPCVAIGGITAENCGILVQQGADFLAVISAVWDNEAGPAAGVKAVNNAIRSALEA